MFALFKKKPPKVEYVEKQVPVYVKSKFEFAHNDVPVFRYILKQLENSCYFKDLTVNMIFMYKYIRNFKNEKMYPIFKMPTTLPTTKSVSNNRIVCIGTIIIDDDNNIISVCKLCSGWSLARVAVECEFELPTKNTIVVPLTLKDNIQTTEISGTIDLDIFKNSIVLLDRLSNMLE